MITVLSAIVTTPSRADGDWFAEYDNTTVPGPLPDRPPETTTNGDALAADHAQLAVVVTAIATVPASGPTARRPGVTAYPHDAGKVASAASTLILGKARPFLGSVMAVPVPASAFRISVTDAEGRFDFIRAQAPATCGAAIDVPLRFPNAPPGIDERMVSPGASSERYWSVLLKLETRSAGRKLPSVVEPTLMAEEMHAGDESPAAERLLPDAITVAIPAVRS